jgi:flagellin
MSLSILNNISALQAENQLAITSAASAKSLQQLSSGSRINSGADDAAGLAIANGLNANIAALNQSSLNVSNAVGVLQTADGALAQVTSLLNRAVTLATEAANSTVTASQSTAINTEYQKILGEIDNISTGTNFNGQAIFGSAAVVTGGAVANSAAATLTAFTSDGTTNTTFAVGIGGTDHATLGLYDTTLAASVTTTAANGTTTGTTPTGVLAAGSATGQANATAALALITTAINNVSQQRGTLGASVEQLQAASTVDTTESQNLTSASSNITSADISTVVANDTKYSILQQTGISALQQANQQAQSVLKLLQ